MRTCADCGRSIADRHREAYLCVACAYARHLKSANARCRRVRYGPNRAEFLRVERERISAKRALRVLEVVRCATEGCTNTFTLNRVGRRLKFCRPCAAFYGGYRSVNKYIADRAKRRRAA